MTLLIEESFELQARLLAASSGNLDEELAVLLWFLQRRFGRDRSTGDITIEPKLTVTTLAKMLGRSRQRVNEAVLKLERRSVLTRQSGWMTILDLSQLQQTATPFLEGGGLANVANVTT
ncbi:MAG: helix-turn-helix domain-containing protein [Candidatus Bipolaricaulia bacterium]